MLFIAAFSLALAGADVAALPDHAHLSAAKGTDYYGVGTEANLTAPTLMTPVSGDFILRAHLSFHFNNTFDGAALLVRADDTHWAKLLVERSQPGFEGVTSSIVRGAGDDAYHVSLKPGQQAIWLKIVRKGDGYCFYTSQDGQAWTIARDFTLGTPAPVTVGLEAQSPLGPGFSADFDHVRLDHKTAGDYWSGE